MGFRKLRSFSWGKLGSWLLSFIIWGVVGMGAMSLWFGYDLPDTGRLAQLERKAGITLLAKDGSLIGTYGDLHGKLVKIDQIPKHVIQALLATEDRRFFSHFGIDVWGILRAAWTNYRAGRVVQGGSTLTQQLAKNLLMAEGLFSSQDRSLRRKIQEILLAFVLEAKLTKQQILTIYLNRIYFGAGVYGLEAAAQKYFHKSALRLTLLEAAMLAGVLKAPSRYSPTHDVQLAEGRAKVVLQNMVEAGFISTSQKTQALQTIDVLSVTQEKAALGRYFSDWVFDQLTGIIGDLNEDMVVHTTLDPVLQKTAEDMLQALILFEGQRYNVHQGALVSMTPSGAIRALVGGVDYSQSQFNRATQAKRQTGSVFKPFVFLGAFERGWCPSDMISDGPIRIGKWAPRNFKWNARGAVTLETAFAHSLNTVTVRLAAEQGWQSLHKLAERLGITTPLSPNLSIALGSSEATLLEMTGAYGTLANHGFLSRPYGISLITTPAGKVLYKHQPDKAERAVSMEVCRYMVRCLRAVVDYGTARKNALSRPAAGKSGTTQKHRDAWFIGFTPDLITGVWMGNDNETSMEELTGGQLPGRLWHDFMEEVHKNKPIKHFQ